MSSNIKKTLEVDFLSAKKIASRNPENNGVVPAGYVLASDGKGESNWVLNTSLATNAFGAVSVNSDAQAIYSQGATLLGNTLKLTSSEPMQLASYPLENRVHMSINTATFLTEDKLSLPYEDYIRETPGSFTYTISCLKKTYFLDLPDITRTYTIGFNGANIPAGKLCTVRVFITNGHGAGTTVNFDAGVRFPAGGYTLTQTGGATDILEFTSPDSGTTWYGVIIAQGLI